MDDETLFMLCDPKKCKPNSQNKMDAYINNYTYHNNILNNQSNNERNTDNNEQNKETINNDENKNENKEETNKNINIIENSSESEEESLPEFMIEVVEHINHIDNFILYHNYDKHMEKINDYLIDLLFLIKSKKK